MGIFKNLIALFYPETCVHCETSLFKTELILCAHCRHQLPLIKIDDYQKNEVKKVFYGLSAIHEVASFLYYDKDGITKKIIHALKYKNKQKVGSFLGKWFGETLKESKGFKKIDFIVPVPLHPSKLKERGYNQLTQFGESLGKVLNIKYTNNYLKKTATTTTQTFKNRFERFSDSNTKFKLTNKKIFKNKHVLLIDDVITTGATLEACCNELQKTDNITISIVTIAFTSKK